MGVSVVFTVVGCGTTKNPEFCCLTEADCAQFGVTEFRSCTEGLACLENTCQPASCAVGTCTAAMPVCEIATDMCVGCSTSNDCTRFVGAQVCDDDGACVECVDNGDCSVSKPICDAKQCRACANDDDCASGACADDGTCLDEASAIYLSPTGTDVAPCSKGAPCRDLKFALEQAGVREHVVFAPGQYTTAGAVSNSPATKVSIHGHGASVSGGSADFPALRTRIPTAVEDLDLICPTADGRALAVESATRLERVMVRAFRPIETSAQVTADDVEIEAGEVGIRSSGTLVFNRVRMHGGTSALITTSGSIDFTDVLIFDTGGVAIDAQNTSGQIKFSTIARTGQATTGTFGVHCSISAIALHASIVWTTSGAGRAPVDGSCTQFVTSILGPAAVPNALNSNPLFVGENANNFRLGAGSPARDAIDAGPTLDLDRATRPQGSRFDLGAFETP